MQIKKGKSLIKRCAALLSAVFMATLLFICSAINVSAAEDSKFTSNNTTFESTVNRDVLLVPTLKAAKINHQLKLIPLAAGATASGSGSTSADSSFQKVVTFFVTWIRRVGALVAFVGGVMFALAIKNNDAEQKQAGLLTLVAGFVAAAVCTAVDMFDIFS